MPDEKVMHLLKVGEPSLSAGLWSPIPASHPPKVASIDTNTLLRFSSTQKNVMSGEFWHLHEPRKLFLAAFRPSFYQCLRIQLTSHPGHQQAIYPLPHPNLYPFSVVNALCIVADHSTVGCTAETCDSLPLPSVIPIQRDAMNARWPPATVWWGWQITCSVTMPGFLNIDFLPNERASWEMDAAVNMETGCCGWRCNNLNTAQISLQHSMICNQRSSLRWMSKLTLDEVGQTAADDCPPWLAWSQNATSVLCWTGGWLVFSNILPSPPGIRVTMHQSGHMHHAHAWHSGKCGLMAWEWVARP